MRGRKRGTIASRGTRRTAPRDRGRRDHNDRRAGAKKAVFVLGDESMEGGDTFDQADVGAANTAVAVANAAETRGPHVPRQGRLEAAGSQQDEFARVAVETGGQAYTYEDTLGGGFQ